MLGEDPVDAHFGNRISNDHRDILPVNKSPTNDEGHHYVSCAAPVGDKDIPDEHNFGA